MTTSDITEIYKDFVICPEPLEFEDAPTNIGKWTIGGFIYPKDQPNQEKSFLNKGVYAATLTEAVTLAISFAKNVIDFDSVKKAAAELPTAAD